MASYWIEVLPYGWTSVIESPMLRFEMFPVQVKRRLKVARMFSDVISRRDSRCRSTTVNDRCSKPRHLTWQCATSIEATNEIR